MANVYSNVLIQSSAPSADVLALLYEQNVVAYVCPAPNGCTLICHEDFESQEQIAGLLSAKLACPALLTMAFGGTILLYHLYVNGERVDAYVSTPHDGLELDGPPPEGNAATLCAAFGMDHRVSSVDRILRKPTKPNTDYAYAVNRHGELLRALKLPLFAAGASFQQIESGELPYGPGFEASSLVRTGR